MTKIVKSILLSGLQFTTKLSAGCTGVIDGSGLTLAFSPDNYLELMGDIQLGLNEFQEVDRKSNKTSHTSCHRVLSSNEKPCSVQGFCF